MKTNSDGTTKSSPRPATDGNGVAGDGERRPAHDLIERIKESADKLQQDDASRGDLKILSRALRELRYAFKVFSPFRSRRKVTVFGSARTLPDDPSYQQAMRFGEAMAQQDWFVVGGPAPPAASWRPGTAVPGARTRWASTSCCPSNRTPTRSSPATPSW